MKVVSLTVGPLQANCYLLIDPVTNHAAVVDPGGDAERIIRQIARHEVAATAILCTHGHPDHVMAVPTLADGGEISDVYMHPADVARISDYALPEVGQVELPELKEYDEGDQVSVGQLAIRVIHTPGHSPGSVCLAVDDENALFSGDLIFAGGVGRVDLPGGSLPLLEASLQRIVNEFPEDTVLYPGHGPESTLAEQVATNPWLV